MTGNETGFGGGTSDEPHCHDRAAHDALDRLFVGKLGAGAYAKLRSHLAGCDECRAQYDRVTRVQSHLEQGVMPEARRDLLASQLLGRLQPATPKPSPWFAWGKIIVPLAAATAAVVLIVPRVVNDPNDEFQARAGATQEAYGVRAFCVAPGESAHVLAEARPGETLRCPENAAVQFTYTAPNPTELEVFTVQGGEKQSFFENTSGALAAGVDEPLPFSTPLNALGRGTHPVQTRFLDAKTGKSVDVPGPTLEIVAQ